MDDHITNVNRLFQTFRALGYCSEQDEALLLTLLNCNIVYLQLIDFAKCDARRGSQAQYSLSRKLIEKIMETQDCKSILSTEAVEYKQNSYVSSRYMMR